SIDSLLITGKKITKVSLELIGHHIFLKLFFYMCVIVLSNLYNPLNTSINGLFKHIFDFHSIPPLSNQRKRSVIMIIFELGKQHKCPSIIFPRIEEHHWNPVKNRVHFI